MPFTFDAHADGRSEGARALAHGLAQRAAAVHGGNAAANGLSLAQRMSSSPQHSARAFLERSLQITMTNGPSQPADWSPTGCMATVSFLESPVVSGALSLSSANPLGDLPLPLLVLVFLFGLCP